MDPKSRNSTLTDIPELDVVIPSVSLTASAFSLIQKHCDVMTYNHTARSALWALIISRKLPQFANADLSLVVISCILHDMGWATTDELLSKDKRFEVDGANIAKNFLKEHTEEDAQDKDGKVWNDARIQRAWDAIALHATPSIANHAAPEVALTSMAVVADFLGPNFDVGLGQNLITMEEYQTVMKLFPREGFTYEGLKGKMCGLCRTKAQTTYDNFVGDFGAKFGTDGEGNGKVEFIEAAEKGQFANFSKFALDALETIDKQSS